MQFPKIMEMTIGEGDGKRGKTEEGYRFLSKGLAQTSREQDVALCDVVIDVQDESFHGSRFVLASVSPVLKRMFLAQMKESQNRIVEVKGVSKKGFQVIWDFIYEDKYGTEEEDVALAVLKDSHFLQIDFLYHEYAEKLKGMLRLEN
ncbi:unnamed protein product, partial [Darwinula stevensoni]